MPCDWEMTFFISDNVLINDMKAGVATLITVSRLYITFSILLPFLKKHFIGIEFTYHTIHPFEVYKSMVFSMFLELCNHYI